MESSSVDQTDKPLPGSRAIAATLTRNLDHRPFGFSQG